MIFLISIYPRETVSILQKWKFYQVVLKVALPMSPLGSLLTTPKFEYPLIQRETQSKSTTQIRKNKKVESDDESKLIELLRESVKNKNRNKEIVIEANKELRNGMTE